MKASSHTPNTSSLLPQHVLDAMSQATLVLDEEGVVRLANAAAAHLLHTEDQDLTGRTLEDVLGPDVSASFRARQFGEPQSVRIRVDGTHSSLVVRFRPAGWGDHVVALLEAGPHVRLTQQVRDVFRSLVQGIRDYGVFMLDPRGFVLTWNEGAERMTGYVPDEIVGRHFAAFFPEDAQMRGDPQRALAIAAELGSYSEESMRVRKDGTSFFADTTLTALRDRSGMLDGFAKVTRDITERREHELKLEANARELQRRAELIDLSPDAILGRDFGGSISFWSQGAEALYGWSAGETIGRVTDELLATRFPVPRAEIDQHLNRYGFWSGELRHRARDGHEVVVLSRWKAHSSDGSRPLEILETNTDITARKQAEERLWRMTQQLEDEVRERTLDLTEVNEQLQEFAHTVAHDLRAPLRGIQGFSSALLEDERGRLSPNGVRYAQNLSSAAEKMDQLIQDLLAYSRLSRTSIELTPVSLDDLFSNVVADLASLIDARNARIDVEPGIPNALAYEPVLIQVVTNLISNAIKFVPAHATPSIKVTAEQRDACVRVSIADNGIGIDPSQQERIFKPFERLHGDDAYPGTGIGLAIVRRGIQRMRGQVGVVSTPGNGTVFWFELMSAPR